VVYPFIRETFIKGYSELLANQLPVHPMGLIAVTTRVSRAEDRNAFGHNLPYVCQRSAIRHNIWTQPSLRLPAIGHQT
jgi:hypothetical protein